jgi:hypothetical protein
MKMRHGVKDCEGCGVDGIGFGFSAMAGFIINNVEPSSSAIK